MALLINENLIHLDIELNTKEEVIKALTQIVLKENRLSSYESCTALLEERTPICNETKDYCYETFLKNVLDREELSTTGIGFGIAIPHGKCCAVAEPTVVFARLKKSIDWQSLDGEPVEAVFLLAVPNSSASNEHLRILAALARKLMHDDFKEMLFTAQDKNELGRFLSEALIAK
jgi:PTS system fructose-specific IIA component